MGIRGLWTKVLSDYSQSQYHFEETIESKGSRLLIDGMAFLMRTMEDILPKQYPGINCPREYGGSYRELNELLHAEFSRLRHYLQFDVVVYFDGPESFFKTETLSKRRKNIEESWNHLYNLSLGDCHNIRQRDLPLPPLVKEEFVNVLQELNIQTIYCDFEADQEMAIACQSYNRKHKQTLSRCFCYSGDSDFLIMKDCDTLAFEALDAFYPSSAEDEGLSQIEVTVWNRTKLAQMYSITEEQVVDWCILIGNDFTGHYSKSMFGGQFTDAVRSPRDLLDLIRNGCSLDHEDLMANDEIRIVVQFCKAFYECEDLFDFFQEEYKSKGLEDIEFVREPGTFLESNQRIQIRSWAIEHQSKFTKSNQSFSYNLVFGFLRHSKDLGIFDVLQDHHLQILQQMHVLLEQDELLDFSDGMNVPYWNNVCAGNLFQLVSRELKKMYNKLVDDKSKQGFQPCRFYHGKLFHQLLHRQGYSVPKSIKNKAVSGTSKATESGASNASTSTSTGKKGKISAVMAALSGQPIVDKNTMMKSSDVILPVDSHRDHILETVHNNRVVIIHGETGCGKSSKIPLFILEDCEARKERCRIIISQPRRIAVVNLRNRLKSFLGDKVGMRMGHGIREESKDTKIFFVTTGYLVRLLAHNPQALRAVTHLIVDEVHERSVDGDLLCWLTKRYLSANLSTKVLLMSATLHTGLYQDYFSKIDMFSTAPPVLSVGVRRFPVDIKHVEQLLEQNDVLPSKLKGLCQNIMNECARMPTAKLVPANLVKIQYELTVALIRRYANIGTGVLVFVSGLADIVELQSRFESMPKYRCVAIHSEIPFEDQECALQPAAPEEVKVVIATNAAESSITLPDVDLVICLGTHKAVNYKPGDLLRSTLTNTWISKSSAVQRAGRTGRVRPGNVFRLYSEKHFERFEEHQEAEIHRTPLHEIVLTLKAIFEDSDEFIGVTPILKDLLEPPDLSKLPHCFDYLYKANMISTPNDESKLTSHGAFAGKMPTDLILSRLIIYGISLGLGAEAVILASALQQPKTVFRIAHPIVHSDPDEYNSIVRQTVLGMLRFDNNVYSEPLMLLQLFIVWQQLSANERQDLLKVFGIVSARIRHFVSSSNHLLAEVNKNLGKSCPELTFDNVADRFNKNNVNKLRLILLWALDFNLIRSDDAIKTIIPTDSPEFASMRVPQGTSIPLSIVQQAFPYPFSHQITEVGKYIYDLPPLFEIEKPIPMVLKNLFLKLRKYDVDQVMVVFKVPQIHTQDYGGNAYYPQQAQRQVVTYLNLIYFAVSRRILLDVKNHPNKPNLLSLSMGLIYPNIPQNLSAYSDIPADISMFGMVLYHDDQVMQLSNYLLSCTSMTISCSPARATKIIAVNFIPSSEILKSMYPPVDYSVDLALFAALQEKTKQPQKTFDISQRIEFGKDSVFTKREVKDEKDEKEKEETKGEEKKAEAKTETEKSMPKILEEIKLPEFAPLFQDLPDGMRLLNAYCMGFKDK